MVERNEFDIGREVCHKMIGRSVETGQGFYVNDVVQEIERQKGFCRVSPGFDISDYLGSMVDMGVLSVKGRKLYANKS